jgi:hypothetical protein
MTNTSGRTGFPRVLIVAENASAKFGGEAFLPLHYFLLLRKRGVEAFLLSHSRVRQELHADFPDQRTHMCFIEDMRLQRALWTARTWLPKGVASVFTAPLIGMATQTVQRSMARQIVREQRIDIVHQPAPVSPKLPSALWNIGAPVVIGPMNGGMTFPAGFTDRQAAGEGRMVAVGRASASLMNCLVPGKRQAALLLVANQRTRAALPTSLRRVPVEMLVENGVDLGRFAEASVRPHPGVPRFAFIGRLVDWKAVDILLEALAAARRTAPIALEIFGDGPQRHTLQQQAARLGLADAATFHGFVPQSELPARLALCDALVLPSLFECGGAVVLEAMALGLPVVATAWGGPADYLDDTCGILIEPKSEQQLVHDLASALIRLGQDPALRECLGHAGRKKVEAEYDWDKKVDRILTIYDRVIAEGRARV